MFCIVVLGGTGSITASSSVRSVWSSCGDLPPAQGLARRLVGCGDGRDDDPASRRAVAESPAEARDRGFRRFRAGRIRTLTAGINRLRRLCMALLELRDITKCSEDCWR